jgi:hypothetical protein
VQPVYTCRSWTNAAAHRRPSTVRLQPTALNIGRLRPAGERSAKPVLMPKLRQGLQLLLRIAIGRLREEGPRAQQHSKCAHHNQRRRHSWSATSELSPRSEGGGSGSCATKCSGSPRAACSALPRWKSRKRRSRLASGSRRPALLLGVPWATPPHPPCAFALPSKFSGRKGCPCRAVAPSRHQPRSPTPVVPGRRSPAQAAPAAPPYGGSSIPRNALAPPGRAWCTVRRRLLQRCSRRQVLLRTADMHHPRRSRRRAFRHH